MAETNNLNTILQNLFEEHDYNKVYKERSIVLFKQNSNTDIYVSKKPVPRFVSITDNNYWKKLNKENTESNNSVPDTPDTPTITAGPLKLTSKLSGSTVIVVTDTNDPLNINLQVSYDDGETWSDLNVASTYDVESEDEREKRFEPITLNSGDSVCFKGNNPNGVCNENVRTSIYTFGTFDVSGRLASICDNNGDNSNFEESEYNYSWLFDNDYLMRNNIITMELESLLMSNETFMEGFRNKMSDDEDINEGLVVSAIESAKDLVLPTELKPAACTEMFAMQLLMTDFPDLLGFINFKKSMFSDASTLSAVLNMLNIEAPIDYNDFETRVFPAYIDFTWSQLSNLTSEQIASILGVSTPITSKEDLVEVFNNMMGPLSLQPYNNMYDISFVKAYQNKENISSLVENDSFVFETNINYPFAGEENGRPIKKDSEVAFYLGNPNGCSRRICAILIEKDGVAVNGTVYNIESEFIRTETYEDSYIVVVPDTEPVTRTIRCEANGTFQKWQKLTNDVYEDYSTDRDITITLSDTPESYASTNTIETYKAVFTES